MSGSIISQEVNNEAYLSRVVNDVLGSNAIVHRYDSTSFSVYLPEFYTNYERIETLENFVKIKGLNVVEDLTKKGDHRVRLIVEMRKRS
jgi:phage-related holin